MGKRKNEKQGEEMIKGIMMFVIAFLVLGYGAFLIYRNRESIKNILKSKEKVKK